METDAGLLFPSRGTAGNGWTDFSPSSSIRTATAARGIPSPTASPRVEVVETVWQHLAPIARNLRPGDRTEALAMGLHPARAIWDSWRASLFCHTCFVDDEPAAVFGLAGAFLDDVGHPWLATTPAIERIKVSFLRYARAEVAIMLRWRPHLVNHVDARYDRAQRFLKALGFTLHEAEPYGPKGELFRKFERIA